MTIAAFFDIDYTIEKSNSAKRILLYLLVRHKVSPFSIFVIMSKFVLRAMGIIDTSELIISIARILKGKRVIDMEKNVEKAFWGKVVPYLYPQMVNKVREHKKKKHKIILVSSEFDFIAEFFKKFLKADYSVSTDIEIKDGKYTGNVIGDACYGPHKVEKLQKLIKRLKIDLKKSYAYSDSITDLPLLTLVGNPVAINPKRKLRKLAERNNWKILNPTLR